MTVRTVDPLVYRITWRMQCLIIGYLACVGGEQPGLERDG